MDGGGVIRSISYVWHGANEDLRLMIEFLYEPRRDQLIVGNLQPQTKNLIIMEAKFL